MGQREELFASCPRGAQGPAFEKYLCLSRGISEDPQEVGDGLLQSNAARSAMPSGSIFVTGDFVTPRTSYCQTCSVEHPRKGARFRARSESRRKSRRAKKDLDRLVTYVFPPNLGDFN